MANAARLMVMMAHPADPFERAGGVVAKHVARGDEAFLVSLTTGVVTHAFQSFPLTGEDKLRDIEQVKATKRREFAEATDILGVTGQVLDFNESPLLVGLDEYITLVNLIREFRPDVVVTSHPVEFGRQDHMDCGRVTVAAVDYARAEGFPSPLAPHVVRQVYLSYYQDYRSEQLTGTARHSADVIVDITEVIAKKKAAMGIFGRTQTKVNEDYEVKLDQFLTRIDGHVGYLHGFGYAEQFNRLNPTKGQYLPL